MTHEEAPRPLPPPAITGPLALRGRTRAECRGTGRFRYREGSMVDQLAVLHPRREELAMTTATRTARLLAVLLAPLALAVGVAIGTAISMLTF